MPKIKLENRKEVGKGWWVECQPALTVRRVGSGLPFPHLGHGDQSSHLLVPRGPDGKCRQCTVLTASKLSSQSGATRHTHCFGF